MSYNTDTAGIWSAGGITEIESTTGVNPEHTREQIRTFFRTRLSTFMADPTNRLHSDPTLTIQGTPEDFKLPALNLYTRSEPAQLAYKETTYARQLTLVVDVYGAEREDQTVEDLIDAIALGVEVLILDNTVWPAYVEAVDLESTEREFTAEAVRRMGRATLTFNVSYSTTFNFS